MRISISAIVLVASLIIPLEITHAAMVLHDVDQNAWYAPYINEAVATGIMSGYKDKNGQLSGMVGPSNAVTAGEAMKMVILAAGYDPSSYGPFVTGPISKITPEEAANEKMIFVTTDYDSGYASIIPCTHWACDFDKVIQQHTSMDQYQLPLSSPLYLI